MERIAETQAQLDATRGTLFPSVPQRGADSITEHLELIDMLQRGDTREQVEAYARQHKLNFLAAVSQQLRNGRASARTWPDEGEVAVATYAYVCQACGEEFEVKRPMSERANLDAHPLECPRCGKNDVRKVVSLFTAIRDWRTT